MNKKIINFIKTTIQSLLFVVIIGGYGPFDTVTALNKLEQNPIYIRLNRTDCDNKVEDAKALSIDDVEASVQFQNGQQDFYITIMESRKNVPEVILKSYVGILQKRIASLPLINRIIAPYSESTLDENIELNEKMMAKLKQIVEEELDREVNQEDISCTCNREIFSTHTILNIQAIYVERAQERLEDED